MSVRADGAKKSISGPGAGNYLTVAEAMATLRNILGDERLKHRGMVQAHGTGTPRTVSRNRPCSTRLPRRLVSRSGRWRRLKVTSVTHWARRRGSAHRDSVFGNTG